MTMPGMGLGPQTIQGFYPYLLLELLVALAALAVLLAARRIWLMAAARRSRPPAAPSPAEPPSHPLRARVALRRTIGCLWILNGLLQAQPAMPNGFPGNVIGANLHRQPGWLVTLLHWEIYLWQAHPIELATAAVLVQVGIGLAILGGGEGRLARIGLWTSIGWGLLVWAGGEALGGLLAPGATELMGAPGAVLAYVGSAGLLLAPEAVWASGRARVLLRNVVGGLLLLGAALQALPAEGFWTGRGLAAMFRTMASVSQPAALAAPIQGMATLAETRPVATNSAFIIVMAAIGLGLLAGRSNRRWSAAALCWFAFTWWVGQDFGAFGTRTATDPNLAPLLAVLLLVARIDPAARLSPTRPGGVPRLRPGPALAAAGIVTCTVAALAGLTALATEASTTAALTIGGPVSPTGPVRLPALQLTDQAGHIVSLRAWPGRVVVLTFLDPINAEACPIIAGQIAAADRALGGQSRRVEFVAVVANPVYRGLAAVRAFDAEQHLVGLPNWVFLTGSLPQLERVWTAFHLVMLVPHLSQVQQPQLLYFVRPGGVEERWAEDVAPQTAAVNRSYVTLIEQQVRALLG